VRFYVPTGLLTVGNIRSALFNWAFARHYGGKLVLRIEDTDQARNTPEALAYTLESLRWLGLLWDEGPEVGGEYGPYKQSERMDVYADVVAKLLEAGKAYHCYCSQEELDQRREAARTAGQHSGYDGHCRTLTPEQVKAYFVDKYGLWILLSPPRQGFNWLVWVVPFAGLALGLAVVAVVVWRWSRRPASAAAAPAPIDEAMRARIARELGEADR